jgi:anti-sigma regulatory factor (Ser/Thr protein kinase)
LDFWTNLFSGHGFMPRRLCGVWDQSLVTLHVVSDTIIWLAYLWIPLVMLWAWRRNGKVLRLHTPMLLIFLLYVFFITACGWTHFFDALMFYNPVYRINGLVRALTAVVSLGTAISLVRLIPQAITAPITILTQRAALHQQQQWLKDILDSATDGVLHLCAREADLPSPLSSDKPSVLEVQEASQLRQVRRMVQQLTEQAEFNRGRAGDLLSAVHEAAMNALVHGGSAKVWAYAAGETVQVWIEDRGPGIPLDKLPISTLKQGYSTAGTAGQGWFLVLSLVDRADLLTGPEGTRLVLQMSRTPKEHSVPFAAAIGGDIHRC